LNANTLPKLKNTRYRQPARTRRVHLSLRTPTHTGIHLFLRPPRFARTSNANLAGKNRKAIDMCGRFTLWAPADPIAYVLSLNLKRRQLSISQRAMVGNKARDLYDRQAKERQRGGQGGKLLPVKVPEAKGDARDIAGAAVGVSGVTVDPARKVRRQGVPELIAAVESGRMSVNAATEIADLPQDVQRDEAKSAGVTIETVLMAEAS
jgi:hypothetical protein